MTTLLTIISFILILGITIFIHELGHFIFAKKAGIYVYEFSLGMGPQLVKWNRPNDETEYSIRLFPIGGFVQMAGEEIEEDENIPKEKRVQEKTWFQRFLTIIGGVLFNFLLAFFLLFTIGLVNGNPNNRPIVSELVEGGSAYNAGLKVGDIIVKVNNKKVTNNDRLLLELNVSGDKETTFEVKRDGQIETIKITPEEKDIDGKKMYSYGIGMDKTVKKGLGTSITYAFTKTGSMFEQMAVTIGYLFTGKLSITNLSGPVGIYSVVGEAVKHGFINLVFLTSLISINVGFINLIPLPAFDGGRLFFLLIEKIRRKPTDAKIENIYHTVGFVLLMILMVLITYNDILRLLKRVI